MSLFTLSAFADEISPDPDQQDRDIISLRRAAHRVSFDPRHQRPGPGPMLQIAEFKKLLDKSGLSS